MIRLVVIFFLFLVLCSCHLKEPDVYKEKSSIKRDTLNVEQIKIPTH